MPDRLISDIIELPERVRKGDFVLNLSRGVTEPDRTLDQLLLWIDQWHPKFGEAEDKE